jgi:hypothetical protein
MEVTLPYPQGRPNRKVISVSRAEEQAIPEVYPTTTSKEGRPISRKEQTREPERRG